MPQTPRSVAGRRGIAVLVVVSGLLAGLGLAAPTPAAAAATPVMGRSVLTAGELAAWYRSKGKTSSATVSIDALATYFIEEGRDEGVAGDLAFAQSIVETGYFGFSTRVPGSFNNFSGLGAVDGGTSAAKFPNARTGVRAQIQHLRAYADPTVTTSKLAHPLVDPRFNLVSPKGKAPNWDQFGNGIWATDPGYASKVLGIYQQMLDHAQVSSRWSPFRTGEQVVGQAYADLLDRPATASELRTGAAALDAGTTTPGKLIAGIVEGEGADHALPVVRLYLAGLGRLPDRQGLHYWTRRHTGGTSIQRLAQQFLGSSEFARRYGSPSDAGFVDVLYRNVLGRAGDPSGVDYWKRRIASGTATRDRLLVQFSESSEHVRQTGPTAEAAVIYLGMVLRQPDPSVLSWWSTKRSTGSSLDVLATLVYESTGFRSRFL